MFKSDRISIKKFQEYIQIPSVYPNVNYAKWKIFLHNYADELSLKIQICHHEDFKSFFVISWPGQNPKLASILLSSQMNMTPYCTGKWTRDPFAAEIDENGNIYGQGTQGTKSIGVQYLEAIRRLKTNKKKLLRTVHVIFLPENREMGLEINIKSCLQDFIYIYFNVGLALDEGHPSSDDHYIYFNEERSIWQFKLKCKGLPTHCLTLSKETAGHKVSYLLNKIYEFRDEEIKKLNENSEMSLGDVTTINVTGLCGEAQANTLPSLLTITLDSRVAVTKTIGNLASKVTKWCEEAGEGIEIENVYTSFRSSIPDVDENNLYYKAFKKALRNYKSKQKVLPENSNLRHLREVGVPVIAFSPIINTPSLAQKADEYLNSEVFLNGIEIYCKILLEVANIPKDEYLN